jgi:hypothetical protein
VVEPRSCEYVGEKGPENGWKVQALNMRPAWKSLAAHHQQMHDRHLRDLFAADARRGERLTAEAVGRCP